MNVYHITYSPGPKIVCLYFWGCNLKCRACLLKKEIYDCHLKETKELIYDPDKVAPSAPERFLSLSEVVNILGELKFNQVIFMGAEPTVDPHLPELANILHEKFHTYNLLLTNGLKLPSLNHIDEVVFSIKAYTESLHLYYTGKSNKEILNNFVLLYRSGMKLKVESVFIPGCIEQDEFERMAQFVGRVDENLPYRIDAYLPAGNNPWRRPAVHEITAAVKAAQKYLKNVSCITGYEEMVYEVTRIF